MIILGVFCVGLLIGFPCGVAVGGFVCDLYLNKKDKK